MSSGMGPVWRHLRTDRSITDQRLAKDTVRRVAGFAKPHRALIGVFLVLTVIDAALVVVTPLLVKDLIDNGILKQDGRLVTLIALAIAGVALVDAALSVGQGYLSSRIGEGLIYDLRTTVFAHV